MNRDRATTTLGIIAAILAALLAVGALTFAGPCIHDDGTASACQASQFGIIGAAVVALACAGASIFAKSKPLAAVLLFVAAAAGLFAALAPGNALPLCMMATMHCRAVMQPFAQFVGVALAAVAVVAGIRAMRKQG